MFKSVSMALVLITACTVGVCWLTTPARATPAAVMPTTNPSTAKTSLASTRLRAPTAKPETAVVVPTQAQIQRWIHALASDQYAVDTKPPRSC